MIGTIRGTDLQQTGTGPSSRGHVITTNPHTMAPGLKCFIYWLLLNTVFVSTEGFPEDGSNNLSYYAIFRRKNLEMEQMTSPSELEASLEDEDGTLHVLLHGLGGSYNHTSNWLIANALFDTGEKNVMAVDYEALVPALDYDRAVRSTETAGMELATFLADVTVPLDLIGFSLGAHIAGIAGHHLKTKFNQTVARIIGLDPANPGFENTDKDLRLDYTDADFVVVIHTAGGAMGGLQPIGHVDFYPNGGREPQPQCTLQEVKWDLKALVEIMCSHSSSYVYLADSTRGGYTATRCSSWERYLDGGCMGEPALHMGFGVPENSRGSYFLRTRDSPPLGDPDVEYTLDTEYGSDDVVYLAKSDSKKKLDAWSLLNGLFIISGQIICIYLIWTYTPY